MEIFAIFFYLHIFYSIFSFTILKYLINFEWLNEKNKGEEFLF
jgi:hypothetical protein